MRNESALHSISTSVSRVPVCPFTLFKPVSATFWDIQVMHDETFRLLKSYEADAQGLCFLYESGFLKTTLHDFENYPEFMARWLDKTNTRALVRKAGNNKNVIFGNSTNKKIREMFCYSHIAACCALFDGWSIPLAVMKTGAINEYIHSKLTGLHSDENTMSLYMENRVHNSDAIRTLQILRLLGLVTVPHAQVLQLSLAAGSGSRDIEGAHMIPEVRIVSAGGEALGFKARVQTASHITLIDNAIEYRDYYAKLNQQSRNVLALNEDARFAYDLVASKIDNGEMRPYNCVIGMRIDHIMMSDIPEFMHQLSHVIDESCDFVVTVGKGHSIDEFRGRKEAMSELYFYLSKLGMKPVRVILHGTGSLDQQRNSPCFGLAPYTTYDMIYCKLDRNKL